MPTLSALEIATIVNIPGWDHPWSMVSAVSVALAESGGDPLAVHVVRAYSLADLSIDRGLWQINDFWHAEVMSAKAFTPSLAVLEVQRISNAGKDWTPWATYKSGAAGKFSSAARAALREIGVEV